MRRAGIILLGLLISAGPLWAHGGHDDGPSLTSPEIPGGHSGAHGSEHEGHAEEAEPVTYGMEEMAEPADGVTYGIEPAEAEGEGTYGLEPPAEDHATHQETAAGPSLFEDPLGNMAPAAPSSEPAGGHSMEGHSMGEHAQHVEPASFKSVPGDAPGRGMAVGITVFTGLVFGLLCLVRPFEKQ